MEGILVRFPVVEFGLEAARVHARLWAELLGRGETVGAHDLIIGATAIAMDFQESVSHLLARYIPKDRASRETPSRS